MDLKPLQHAVVDWANGISPNRLPKDAVVKIVSEASELLDAVLNDGDVEGELGDCLILLTDLADMYGIDLVRAGWRKHDINLKRKWVTENGVIRRVRDNEAVREAEITAGQEISDLLHVQGSIGSGAQLQRGDDRRRTGKSNRRRPVPG